MRQRSSQARDVELVALCRKGEDAAWGELVEGYSGYVHSILGRGFRMSQHDAEDVFQEVFARLYEKLETIRDDEAVRGWIGQTTRRLAIDRFRWSRREGPSVGDDLPEPAELDARLERLDDALDVREGLSSLPEACREILTRFFLRDQSYETISADLDLPAGTIASRISRCLAKLKEHFEGSQEPAPPSGGSEGPK